MVGVVLDGMTHTCACCLLFLAFSVLLLLLPCATWVDMFYRLVVVLVVVSHIHAAYYYILLPRSATNR